MQAPDSQADTAGETAAPAPTKPRAPRRSKAAVEAATSTVEGGQPAAEAAEAPAKPARKTVRRRKVDESAETPKDAPSEDVHAAPMESIAPVSSEPSSVAAEAAPAVPATSPADEAPAPRRGRRKPVAAASAEVTEAAPMAPEATPSAEPREAGVTEEGARVEQEPGVGPRRAAMAAQRAEEVVQGLLTGDFDREQDVAPPQEAEAYKRVLRPEPDAPKLQKVLAQSGVGSRRDIEKMIEDGRIEVNDQVAHIGQRVSFGDRIKLDGKPIRARITPPPARILAYHKPVGEVVTHDDPEGRPTVFRSLPRLQHGKWMSVGRLDLNTEGLLLFTTSGELANQLMHPRFGVEREYAVRVLGTLDDAARERLLSGVDIDGQQAAFKSISNGLGEGVNQWYRVVIMEGRNREVRKLFDAVGLTVSRLIRVRYGAIVLPRGLRRGVWVELGESDVRAIKSLVGLDRQDRQEQGRGAKGKRGRGGRPQDRGPQDRPPQGRGPQQGVHGPQGGRGSAGPGGKPSRPPVERDRPAQGRDEFDDDDLDNIGRIPNPLEQTFDRRFVKGSQRIVSGFGRPDHEGTQRPAGGKQKEKGPRQPDPMQTSVGYIGADAYFGGGGRRGGQGGGRRGRR
ncbi:MAG: 23S rRNA pseudouridine(2605) synthase RluB [Aquabacterium sp.]